MFHSRAPLLSLVSLLGAVYACSVPYAEREHSLASSPEGEGPNGSSGDSAPSPSSSDNEPNPSNGDTGGDGGSAPDSGSAADASGDARLQYTFWTDLCTDACRNITKVSCGSVPVDDQAECVADCKKQFPKVPAPSCAPAVETYLKCCAAKSFDVLCSSGGIGFDDCDDDKLCEAESLSINCPP